MSDQRHLGSLSVSMVKSSTHLQPKTGVDMPLFLFCFPAQSSCSNNMLLYYSNILPYYLVIHKACSLIYSAANMYQVSRAGHRAGHWDYRDGHNVAPHSEESGPGADTKQMMLPVRSEVPQQTARGAAECWRGAPPLHWGSEGLGDHTERHQDEQVFVRWNSTNTNTVDALSSPTKQVLLSSQQPYAGVTVLILQWRNGEFKEANDLSPKDRVGGTRLAPLHSKPVESEALSSSPWWFQEYPSHHRCSVFVQLIQVIRLHVPCYVSYIPVN